MAAAMDTKLVWYYSCRCGNQAFTEVRRRATCTACGAMQVEEIPLEEARARLAAGQRQRRAGKDGRARTGPASPRLAVEPAAGSPEDRVVQATLFDLPED